MVRVFSQGFQVPSSAAVATSETGAFFSCLLGFKTCCSFLWVASPLSLGWDELMQVMWYLHSYQVTEQWTSCAGQETPDIRVWRAQMLSTVINQLQVSPQLCYSKNAWNSVCFTSQNPVFFICNKAEQLFNVLSEFSSLWKLSQLSQPQHPPVFFFKMDFLKEYHWKLKWGCYFLSHSLDKSSLPLHTNRADSLACY